jgi:glycerol-3-phosphate dehydrogenase (NAD(P)+)
MDNEISVAIIGAGQLGSAVGSILRKNGISPALWDADPAKVPGQKSLEEAVRPAGCVLLCVPSWAMRKAVASVVPFLASGAMVVSFAKGIESETEKTMSELLTELLPASQPFAVVGGPMLAHEISDGKHAIGVFASASAGALRMLKDLFSSPDIAIELADDSFGVSVAGVLKNIYAVGIGMADGLELGDNEKGWLASLSVREMMGIGHEIGVSPKIFLGTAGIGDFIATAWSASSQNHQIGVEIAVTGTCATRGEGLASVTPLLKRLGSAAGSFPLLALIAKVGIDCSPARPAFEAFFQSEH